MGGFARGPDIHQRSDEITNHVVQKCIGRKLEHYEGTLLIDIKAAQNTHG